MKILCIIPPYIPSYFNAGHHLGVFLVSSYIRKNFPSYAVEGIDAAALNYTWKEMCNLLVKQYDVICLYNDYDAADTFQRFMYYLKTLAPKTKVITFGRLSKQVPKFFFQFNIDAIAYRGDYELCVRNYLLYLEGKQTQAAGVLLHPADTFSDAGFMQSTEWALPNVNEVPYAAYNYMYRDDLNKFCGIPDRQELVVPLARGCPVGCDFCDVPPMQGKLEKRLSVDATLAYIVDCFQKLPFEYVSFYAPTFTLNRKWVLEFCEQASNLTRIYPWKCVTVLKMLDDELLAKMAQAGCVRISLGIETFSASSADNLPVCKREMRDKFIEIAQLCQLNGIELNCFIMLGYPGDTPAQVLQTIEFCREMGARVRPTIYTNYHLMREDMSINEVNQFNRQLFTPGLINTNDAEVYYQFFFNNKKDLPTAVTANIPSIQNLEQMQL